jgi:hypothetical protein
MLLTRLALQVFPFTLIGLLVTLSGVWFWPTSGTSSEFMLRGLLLALSFLALMGLKKTPNWNLGVLILFSFQVGSFINLLSPAGGLSRWWLPLGVAFGLLIVSWWISRFRIALWGEIGVGLWLLTWMYVLGWGLLFVIEIDPLLQRVWAGFGMCLFTGMTTIWFARSESALKQSLGSSLGIDLYLLTLNLILASRLLIAG